MATGRIPINGTAAIQETIVDAKGDLIVGTGADAVARLAVGANNTVLTADSAEATGLKWATPSGDAAFTLLNAGGTALTGAATITVSGITKNNIFVLIAGASSASANSDIRFRINTDSTSKYTTNGLEIRLTSSYVGSGFGSTVNAVDEALDGNTYFQVGSMSGNVASRVSGYVQISGAKSTGPKILSGVGGPSPSSSGSDSKALAVGGIYTGTSAVSSISLISGTGNFDAGTLYVYEG